MLDIPTRKIAGSNGSLVLGPRFGGLLPLTPIHGGPFRNAPAGMAAICLREDLAPGRDKQQTLHLPIADYSVPHDLPKLHEALRFGFRRIMAGKPLYVGCTGGWGRTGLFLALLAKTAGVDSPVSFVRYAYAREAVETPQQESYVANFDPRRLRWWLWWQLVSRKLTGRLSR